MSISERASRVMGRIRRARQAAEDAAVVLPKWAAWTLTLFLGTALTGAASWAARMDEQAETQGRDIAVLKAESVSVSIHLDRIEQQNARLEDKLDRLIEQRLSQP